MHVKSDVYPFSFFFFFLVISLTGIIRRRCFRQKEKGKLKGKKEKVSWRQMQAEGSSSTCV